MTETATDTRRVLLVDDDPIVLRIYQNGLKRLGFQVETAIDGFTAMKLLRGSKPDVVVLDLMMPRFSGVEVLKFIRSQPELTGLPVIVLSNSYMDQLARDAATVGAQKALLKVRCTPAMLKDVIYEVLGGKSAAAEASVLMAVPRIESDAPRPPAGAPIKPSVAPAPVPASKGQEVEFQANARRDFLENAPATCAELRDLFQKFTKTQSDAERNGHLQTLYRLVHFITATAGLAECHLLAQTATVFEALLFEVMAKPAHITPSVLRTMALTVDFLDVLFHHARDAAPGPPPQALALVVDDDPLSNRIVVSALRRASLEARSTEDPLLALQWLQQEHFHLILLDVEMPGMNGFEVCGRLRKMPGYQKTPVIYVTSHSDFQSRAKSVLSGGDDLIAKPVFPIELAVKAVTHLLKGRVLGK